MFLHDRLRARFLSALGLGLIACEGRESAAPSSPPVASVAAPVETVAVAPSPSAPASSATEPPASDASADAAPAAPVTTEGLPKGCRPAAEASGAPRSTVFADCAKTIVGRCCGRAGGSPPCDKPLLENVTRDARARPGAGAVCCYRPDEVCRGRPLRAHHGSPPIVAAAQPSAGVEWAAALRLELPHDRSAGQRWLEIAADEHASVASFAVVSLQLLALGAPAELVADTHRAALDEIEHARAALAVASAYLGEPHTMGPLDVPRVATLSFEELARSTFRDACGGETVASVRARDEASRASDPAVAAVLRTIADDEERHAELGWRTVAWLVARGGDAARDAIRAEVAAMRGSTDPVVRDVVIPCAEALLRSSGTEPYFAGGAQCSSTQSAYGA